MGVQESDRIQRGLAMGVNRIVMHNGVVWWLPPLRPRPESADGEPSTTGRTPVDRPVPRRRPRSAPKGRPHRPAAPGAMPPAGFIPLSSLGIPGIDSILDSHADFYRDAYDRAVRDQTRRGDGTAPGEERPEDQGLASS